MEFTKQVKLLEWVIGMAEVWWDYLPGVRRGV